MADPLTALMHAVQLTNFLKLLIETKLEERQESLLESHSCQDSPRIEPRSPSGSHKKSDFTAGNKTVLTSTENYPTVDDLISSPAPSGKASDCQNGLTEKTQSNKACGRSYKPQQKRGSTRGVNEKQVRINSRSKKLEAWR